MTDRTVKSGPGSGPALGLQQGTSADRRTLDGFAKAYRAAHGQNAKVPVLDVTVTVPARVRRGAQNGSSMRDLLRFMRETYGDEPERHGISGSDLERSEAAIAAAISMIEDEERA